MLRTLIIPFPYLSVLETDAGIVTSRHPPGRILPILKDRTIADVIAVSLAGGIVPFARKCCAVHCMASPFHLGASHQQLFPWQRNHERHRNKARIALPLDRYKRPQVSNHSIYCYRRQQCRVSKAIRMFPGRQKRQGRPFLGRACLLTPHCPSAHIQAVVQRLPLGAPDFCAQLSIVPLRLSRWALFYPLPDVPTPLACSACGSTRGSTRGWCCESQGHCQWHL